jgi:hypothetical protein
VVIRLETSRSPCRQRAALTTDLIVAMAILALTTLPLSFAFVREMKLCRNYYYLAVAMEIVDGEMEILAGGEWRASPNGAAPYPVRADAATNLPPGQFRLTRTDRTLRLEWLPEKRSKGIKVAREWQMPGTTAAGLNTNAPGTQAK